MATLWLGGPLGALEKLCLSSFVVRGHRVVAFTFDPALEVPDGVETADAAEIWPLDTDLLRRTGASYIADIWRLHLMQQTDFIWIDTDAFCWRDVTLSDAYLLGWYHGGHHVNTGVLRVPRHSEAVQRVLDWFEDPDFVPGWIRPVKQRQLAEMQRRERLVAACKLRRSMMGPFALTPALQQSGEIAHVLPEDVLYPIPLELGDVYFNPHGGWEGWVTPQTMMLHFFTSALRGGQRNLKDAKPGSLMHRLIHRVEAERGLAPITAPET